MKKGLLWILVGVLLIVPFITVKASANVQISKVELVESSDGTVINAEPTASGLNLNFNITFGSVNDYAKYSVTIKNNDGEDYKISNTEPTVSDYMKYEFVFEDDSNIIKANSEKKLNIVITYKQEVPQEELVDGKYTEINNVDVKLVNAITNEEINNPNTSDNILLYINLLLVSVILCGVAIKSKKVRKSVAVITLMLVALPLSVKALEEITIKLNTAVEISKEREFCFMDSASSLDNKYFNYTSGQTWEQFLDNTENSQFFINDVDDFVFYKRNNNILFDGEIDTTPSNTLSSKPTIYSEVGKHLVGLASDDKSNDISNDSFETIPLNITFYPMNYINCMDEVYNMYHGLIGDREADELTEEEWNEINDTITVEYQKCERIIPELNLVKKNEKIMSKDKGCYNYVLNLDEEPPQTSR